LQQHPYSYPIKVSYADGSVPTGVALPANLDYCPDCTGLDFNDTQGNNADLVNSIIDENKTGYYVFSAPWKTTRALMEHIYEASQSIILYQCFLRQALINGMAVCCSQ